MNLLIDVGNTRIKYVTENEGALSDIKVIENQELSNVQSIIQWFDHFSLTPKQVIIASVNQSTVHQALELFCLTNQIAFTQVQTEKKRFGIQVAYQNPIQMGVDRWLALIGAARLYPKENILIVDSGTATTLELLTANGQHKGGWILPGIETMFTSLALNTEQVIAQKENISHISLGHNTTDCVNNALWAATVGLITQAEQLSKERGIVIDKIIVTGGNAEKLSDLLPEKLTLIPKLIFYGLAQYSTIIAP